MDDIVSHVMPPSDAAACRASSRRPASSPDSKFAPSKHKNMSIQTASFSVRFGYKSSRRHLPPPPRPLLSDPSPRVLSGVARLSVFFFLLMSSSVVCVTRASRTSPPPLTPPHYFTQNAVDTFDASARYSPLENKQAPD